MRIAIVGGTHGNEPVGVEVVKALKSQKFRSPHHEYETFIGNPEALKQKKRFVDSDLNRAFGKNSLPYGLELARSKELTKEIKGKFDLIIDLHTTTTNMGLTAILNNSNSITRQTCCFLNSNFKGLKLIEEIDLDDECTHLNRMAPAGVTIEVGPVANNVVSGDLVLKTYKLVTAILNWDFKEDFDYNATEVFKTETTIFYPEEKGWFIHPDVEGKDFKLLKNGDPLFINIKNQVINHASELELYPFFINEAAYLNDKIAMILARKIN